MLWRLPVPRLRLRLRPGRVVLLAGGQIVVLAAGWQLYRYGRFLVRDQRTEALANATDVLAFERRTWLFVEPRIQQLALETRAVMDVLNSYYVYTHIFVTVGCLVWLYVGWPAAYRSCRRVLCGVMALGLLAHAAYPLAPPRLVPASTMVDTLAIYGPTVYSDDQFASITNQFAAMPSFHVGWAALVAFYVIAHARTPFRWLVLAHPLIMAVAVMATANHYLVDALAGAALVLVGIAVDHRVSSWSAARTHRGTRGALALSAAPQVARPSPHPAPTVNVSSLSSVASASEGAGNLVGASNVET